MTRVFILAASLVARAGLEAVLQGRRSIQIVGSAADLETLGERLSETEPDVLVADATDLDEEASFQELFASDIAHDLPVVLLTDPRSSANVAAALRAGVRAVLPRDVSSRQLLAALEAAAVGLVVVRPAEVASVVVDVDAVRRQSPADLAEALTAREREVLQMLAGGLGNKEIAAKLSISEHTVKFHVASILGKLGASTRTEAVFLGIRHGLILL